MADELKVEKPVKAESKVGASIGKKYFATNRSNAPLEIQNATQTFFKRLEPRGREGDSVELPEWFVKSDDFATQKKDVIFEER